MDEEVEDSLMRGVLTVGTMALASLQLYNMMWSHWGPPISTHLRLGRTGAGTSNLEPPKNHRTPVEHSVLAAA
jgi:hypothetical protein